MIPGSFLSRQHPTAKIELYLLGETELVHAEGADVGTLYANLRTFALLAFLAAAGPRPGAFHRRDRLVGLFWPESGQEQARTNLRQLVHRIRRVLGEEVIESRGDEELRVPPEHLWCDVAEFERATAEGRLARADEVYRGELMPAFHLPGAAVPDFEEWLSERRTELAERAADVAWQRALRLEGEQKLTMAQDLAHRAIRLSVCDERRFRRAVELLERVAEKGKVFAAYEVLCRRLAEYGAKPSRQTEELIERIRRR
jgi:DNA-binding SARP family transcriptional activator